MDEYLFIISEFFGIGSLSTYGILPPPTDLFPDIFEMLEEFEWDLEISSSATKFMILGMTSLS
jgi:hypothetical protein